MKKFLVLVCVLSTAAFAANEITFTGADAGGGVMQISYDATGSDSMPVGMALNVVLSDATVADTTADVVTVNADFPVYIDYVHDLATPFDPCDWDPCTTTYSFGDGTPLADADAAGVAANGVSEFSICLGRLDPCAAGDSGVLIEIQLTKGVGASTDVTVIADELRGGEGGGVVGSTYDVINVPAPFTVVFDGAPCFTEGYEDSSGQIVTAADVARYAALPPDKQACWCYDCFGSGDANGDCAMDTADLYILIDVGTKAFTGDACADFNYDGVTDTADLYKLIDVATKTFMICPVSCTPI